MTRRPILSLVVGLGLVLELLTAAPALAQPASGPWSRVIFGSAAGPIILSGTGSPAGVVSAPGGSLYLQSDGAAGLTLWTKTGTGSSGWAAPGASSSTGGTYTTGITVDGAGAAFTAGVKGFAVVARTGTITAATLLSTDAAATACSVVFDIWRDTFANYPPTVADTITASARPTLASANKATSALTGWSTAVTAGDVLGYSVVSNTGCTRATLVLTVTP